MRTIALVCLLTGCAQFAENYRAAEERRIDGLRSQCGAYGYRSNSDVANCVANLDAAETKRQQAAAAAAQARALQPRPVDVTTTTPAPRGPVFCQDMGFGSVMCQ